MAAAGRPGRTVSEARQADALEAIEAALQAVNPKSLVEEYFEHSPLPDDRRVHLAAIGKGAAGMVLAAVRALGDRLVGGVVVTPADATSTTDAYHLASESLSQLEHHAGGHPLPNEGSLAAGRALSAVARRCATSGDQLLVLLSGGASALAVSPHPGLSLQDLRETTDLLLRHGTPIDQLNTVRIALDQLKGGGLAAMAHPALVLALVLSDVVGDRLDLIGSGPTLSPSSSDLEATTESLRERDLWHQLAPSVSSAIEQRRRFASNPTDEHHKPTLEVTTSVSRVETRLIGNLQRALEAATLELSTRGYCCVRQQTPLVGEARLQGAELARWSLKSIGSMQPGERRALIVGGETTVNVAGSGLGGRNQELALAAALALEGSQGITLASLATDGVDGPTDAAGAIVDGSTIPRARQLGLDPAGALSNNDSYPLLDQTDALIRRGPTGTNVADIQLVLVEVPTTEATIL